MKGRTFVAALLLMTMLLPACSKETKEEGEGEVMATPSQQAEASGTPTPFVPENPDVMPSTDEELVLDLSTRASVYGQGIGTLGADGEVKFPKGVISKCLFPMGASLERTGVLTITVSGTVSGAKSGEVSFYLSNESMGKCSSEKYVLQQTDGTFTESFTLEASATATAIMLSTENNDSKLPELTISEIRVSGELEIVQDGPISYEQAVSEPWYQELLAKAQMNLGNNKRLRAVIQKAQAGEEITIATIGGSITEGAGATKYKECYAYQIYEGFRAAYGAGDGDNVSFVNAGVGGTPSTFGYMRYGRDIVSRVSDPDGLPDIVIVEYAVNDGGEPTNHQCYESMVKEILQQPNEPAVILLFSVFPTGYNLQDELKEIGETYDLMMISIKDGAFPYVGDKWTEEEFFYDVYHPTTLGHKVMADCVLAAIAKAWEAEEAQTDIDLTVPAAYGTSYLGLTSVFHDSCAEIPSFSVGGFSSDDAAAYANTPIGKVCGKNFHHAADGGSEPLSFTATCKNLLIAYRAVNDASFGSIDIFVDGEKVKTIAGNTGSWGQSVVDLVFSEETASSHRVEIRMAGGDENKKFTITCLAYTP